MRLGHGHDIAAYLIFSVVASLCIEEEHEEGNPKENGCCFYCSSCRRRNNAGTANNIGSWKLQTEERYGILHLFNHSPAPTHPHPRPHQHQHPHTNMNAATQTTLHGKVQILTLIASLRGPTKKKPLPSSSSGDAMLTNLQAPKQRLHR